MAQRRMFSKTITNSSQFLMMPSSSQNLYFHLGMNADDDGFCEHFAIMRMTDSKPDDLKILQAKSFINIFDDKVLVILDWKENNYLRSDRYNPSKYLSIYGEELKRLSSGIPNVYQWDTQDRLGKDRLGKELLDKSNNAKAGGDVFINKIIETFKEKVGHNPTDPKPRYEAYNLVRRIKKLIKEVGKETTDEQINRVIERYFEWLDKQDWFINVQNMSVIRRKFEIYQQNVINHLKPNV